MTTPYRTPAEIVPHKPKFHLWCWLRRHKYTTIDRIIVEGEHMGHTLQYPKLRAVWLACSRCGGRKNSPTLIESLPTVLLQHAFKLYELETFRPSVNSDLDQLLEEAAAGPKSKRKPPPEVPDSPEPDKVWE